MPFFSSIQAQFVELEGRVRNPNTIELMSAVTPVNDTFGEFFLLYITF